MNRICLIGTDTRGMFYSSENTMPVGGEAIQKYLLAKAFAELGYEISTVIRSADEGIDKTVDGIRVLSAFRFDAGIPGIRFFHPRATGFFRALKAADADVYYQSPAGAITGLTAAFCQLNGRKFIFRVASDVDCIPGQNLIKLWRDRVLYDYGLRHADLIAVQSRYQQQLLIKHYGLESTIVNMAMELPEEDLDGERDVDVLWISNLKVIKRPDNVLTLANRLPHVQFTMIGGRALGAEDIYSKIEREASIIPNLQFLGHVPYREVNRYIARSKLLLNTSEVEGFPNTFLQAWVRKVPVVSFFDPDGIIEREGLGRRPQSNDEMCAALRELLIRTDERERIGCAARAFALDRFSPMQAARHYIEALQRAVSARATDRPRA